MTPDLWAGISAGLFALAIFLSPALALRRQRRARRERSIGSARRPRLKS